MAYKLEVNHPDFPKDFPFNCDGILVKNKGSVTVTKEMEVRFLKKNRKSLKDIYGHSEIVKLSGSSELTKDEREKEGGES